MLPYEFFLFLAHLLQMCPLCIIHVYWCRNLNLLSIRPGPPRSWLPHGRTLPQETLDFLDGKDSTSVSCHSFGILFSILVHMSSRSYFILYRTPSSLLLMNPQFRCINLAPVISTSLDQWAITHFLNEWLLLSQHPAVWCKSHRFPLSYILGP